MAAGFVVGTVAYGVYFSFGIFYPPMVQEMGWTRTEVTGAFSISLATYSIAAVPMGFLVDRFGPRVAVIVGGLFFGAGVWLGSRVDQPWQLYVLYGIIIASGMGAAYVPLVSTVTRWFDRYRGLAVGIASLGSGAGTFFVTPLIAQLLLATNWRTAYAVSGITAGAAIVVFGLLLWRDPAGAGLKPYGFRPLPPGMSQPPAASRSVSVGQALRTPGFWVQSAMYSFWWFGSLIVYVLGVDFMLSRGASPALGALFLTVIGLGNAAGKVVWGILSDRLGPRQSFYWATLLELGMLIGLIVIREPILLIVTAAVFAFGFGGGSPQLPTLTAELFGSRSLGLIFGLIFAIIGIVGALGPVLGGFFYDASGSYTPGLIAGALALTVALLLCQFLPSPAAARDR